MLNKKKNKKILVISHNSLSAGTSTQTMNFVKHLINNEPEEDFHFILPSTRFFKEVKNNSKNVILHYMPYREGWFGYLLRLFIEVLYIPFYIIIIKPNTIFGLTNYFLIPGLKAKKVVLLRHPYMLEDADIFNFSIEYKIKEYIRKYLFSYTLNLVDHVIVQTDYMFELFEKKYPHFKKELTILPNPIDTTKFKINEHEVISFFERDNILIYPSRYAPHKNHEFIISLVSDYYSYFKENNIRFFITLQKNKENKAILAEIENSLLSDVIINIGEVSQTRLAEIYQTCKAIFFPSKTETFGNALVEGLFFNIPVVAPDLPYAKSICGAAGSYYIADNTKDAFEAVKHIVENKNEWRFKSDQASIHKNKYLSIAQWTDRILQILFKRN